VTRRSSAFSDDLADLDALQALPLPTSTAPARQTPARVGRDTRPGPDEKYPARPTRSGGTALPGDGRGTRATQVRLPPHLADWLSKQAAASGRTLGSVVALAARTHTDRLPLPNQPEDELDVRRRSASGSIPVTLRLTQAQRHLLDDLAVGHQVTRSAIVVAALTAASAPPHSST
jgi:hypothetical protein